METISDSELKPDIHVIAIDETSFWDLPKHMMAVIKRIETCYFFDMNKVTYLCSATPSYELTGYQCRAVFTDEFYDTLNSSDAAESMKAGMLEDSINSLVEENFQGNCDYFHCDYIHNLIKHYDGKAFVYTHYVDSSDDSESYEEFMDGMLEKFISNPPI